MTAEPFFLQRVEDLVMFRVEPVNLERDGTRLVREDPDAPALLIFHLPPQHVNEDAVLLQALFLPDFSLGFVSGLSRLVFMLPDGEDSIEISSQELLDWNHLQSTTVPNFEPDPFTDNVFGGTPRTLIEFPTRLFLGLEGTVEWSSTMARPVTLDGRTELFHADLHGENGGEALLRAFATPQNRPSRAGLRLPLTDHDLGQLVKLTHHVELIDETGLPVAGFERRPLRAERFVLTPIGASVRMGGLWNPTTQTSLTAYNHRAELGRDEYVQVTREGFLSSGHRALLVRTTERKFTDPGDDTSVAFLHQETYVNVLEPEVFYDQNAGFPRGGLEMPFRSLRVTETSTPPINDGVGPFWVTPQGAADPYPFTVVATDSEGRHISFTMPMMFIPFDRAHDLSVAGLYNSFEDRRQFQLGGQKAALAQAPVDAPGITSMPVASVKLVMTRASQHPLGMLPTMESASVRVPAVEQLTGLATESAVTFHENYLAQGFDGEDAGAFLSLAEQVPVDFGGGKGGGLARPNAAVQAITARAGLLPKEFAEASAAVQGMDTAQLAAIFGDARLLGVINLFDLLDAVPSEAIQELATLTEDQIMERIEGRVQELLPVPIMRARELAEGREIRYLWKPQLKREKVSLDGGIGFATIDMTRAALVMEATTVCSPQAVEKSTVRGELTGFALEFAGIVGVEFEKLAFTARPGSRPDLSADGLSVRFESALEFVNTLKDLLPTDGFGKGSFVDVSPTGITAGYTLAVPAVSVGIFALSNVTLTAALTVPFDDRPATFRFSISERHQPFNLSVSMFGGGGFFALTVSTKGVELIEGSLEFGGNASLDLGVASGGVHLMGGVYFALERGGAVTLTGYVRCGGYLSVLGLISISVEFQLKLTYVKEGNETAVFGEGSVTVSVKVVFFSKSVSLRLQRRFAGSAPAPRGFLEATAGAQSDFAACVEPADWDEYCLAFAP
ncbi:hypothetical protein AB0M39_30135 [Streptomyces sp. NPDC051907]|uniref:hypothetical protein n=1 Tax=Streptomyces sp. NPDC051907 TaxID=3155284 RepID=UPI003447AA09